MSLAHLLESLLSDEEFGLAKSLLRTRSDDKATNEQAETSKYQNEDLLVHMKAPQVT